MVTVNALVDGVVPTVNVVSSFREALMLDTLGFTVSGMLNENVVLPQVTVTVAWVQSAVISEFTVGEEEIDSSDAAISVTKPLLNSAVNESPSSENVSP